MNDRVAEAIVNLVAAFVDVSAEFRGVARQTEFTATDEGGGRLRAVDAAGNVLLLLDLSSWLPPEAARQRPERPH